MKELRFPNINSMVISGRLTRDVELRYLNNATATPVAKLSIAFNRNFQKNGEWQQEVGYIDVVVWSERGKQCAEQLKKGSPVLIEGYLRTRSYVDKNEQNRKITEIVSTKVSFLEKSENQYSSQEEVEDHIDQQQGNLTHEDVKKEEKKPSESSGGAGSDDDVPF